MRSKERSDTRRLRRLGVLAGIPVVAGALIATASVAHADPGDVQLNPCTDPANQACFSPRVNNLNLRNGPGTGFASEGTIGTSTVVSLCQVMGQNIGGNAIWDFVGTDPDAGTGLFVSDFYMNTPTFGTNPSDRKYPCP